jgi:hypothetical protein
MDETKPPQPAPKPESKDAPPREPTRTATPAAPGPAMLSNIERAAQEMAQRSAARKSPAPTEPVPPMRPAERPRSTTDFALVDQYESAGPSWQALSTAGTTTQAKLSAAQAALNATSDDHVRLSLSGTQSFLFATAILALVLLSFAMASHAWVAAHDWSCRAGIRTDCPQAPTVPKPIVRQELPT